MGKESYRIYAVYVGVILCTILLVFSIFMAMNLITVLLKAKQTEGVMGGIAKMVAAFYFPDAILQVQLCLISVVLMVLVVNSSKEPISAKEFVLSFAIGAIIGIDIIYYLMSVLSYKPYP